MNDSQHASDVAQRDTNDDGFSAGWGGHFLPAERYVIDCHVHVHEKEPWAVREALDKFFRPLEAARLDQIVVMDGGPGSVDVYGQVAKTDRRFHFMIWMKPERPDVKFLRRAHELGAVGIKLHNSRIMRGEFPWTVWESDEWRAVFDVAAELGMPILWHVTQETTGAEYVGEGPKKPWRVGGPNGEVLTNQDLLDQFLRIVEKYPRITFVGAHVLYVGDQTLDKLFAAHPNLTVDTSVGYFVRMHDQLLEADATAARAFLCKWPDRILFGTDSKLGVAESNEVVFAGFHCHVRYLHQVRLPQDVLDQICWQNTHRIFGLSAGDDWMKGCTRP